MCGILDIGALMCGILGVRALVCGKVCQDMDWWYIGGVRVAMGDIPGERAFMGGIFCVRAVRCVTLGINAVWMIHLVSKM